MLALPGIISTQDNKGEIVDSSSEEAIWVLIAKLATMKASKATNSTTPTSMSLSAGAITTVHAMISFPFRHRHGQQLTGLVLTLQPRCLTLVSIASTRLGSPQLQGLMLSNSITPRECLTHYSLRPSNSKSLSSNDK